MSLTCPSCGSPVVPDARFCFSCGAALAAAEQETERRVVTVLFGDLSDFTSWAEDLDPERVGTVTDRVLATLAAAVTEFGGHVDKLTGDGLMAVFGAPVAHEDDAERAVRAAARMQEVVRQAVEQESGGGRQLGLRVGLNTGTVVAGVQAQLSYTVVGDAVNTAARLSDAAGVGAVLAGQATALATVDAAAWRALPTLRLKGKREPVAAYELTGLRAAGTARIGLGEDAPLVGREAELGLLAGRLTDSAARRRPWGVLMTGDAGIGKTRLARELARVAGRSDGARVLWGRCPPYGAGRDFAPVVQLVRTACGVSEADDPQVVRERVGRLLSRLGHPSRGRDATSADLDALLRLLGDAEEAAPPREGATPGPAVTEDPACAAVRSLFVGLARERPLLLVLDDLHWATPTLLAGLREVATGLTGPVVLLGLGRPELLAADPWWQELPDLEVLPLLPLDDAATERLLAAHLGEELDPAATAVLLARAQGNPFFLAELLHLLVDRGALRRLGTRWVLEGPLPDDVPAGVQAVLAARIDGLGGPAKGVLRDASVLGTDITAEALEAVGRASGHGSPEVVSGAMALLVERQLLQPEAPGVFGFAHTLVRDVSYRGLGKGDRARRHAAAAQYAAALGTTQAQLDLAAVQGERAVVLAAEMGLPAEDPSWAAKEVAVAALSQLGARALDHEDNAGAEALLGRALRLCRGAGPPPDPVTLRAIQLGRARALAVLHRLAEAEGALAELLDSSGAGAGGAAEEPPDEQRAAAFVVLGEVRRKAGDPAAARSALVRAVALAGTAGSDRVSGEALRQLGLLDYFEGRLRDAEQRFDQAQQLAVRVGDRRGAGWALQHLAWGATTRGDYAVAERALAEAAALFGRLEDTPGGSWVAGTEGLVRLLQGRLAEARALAQSTLPRGQAAGERWGVAALLTIDALAAAELGDVDTGAREAEEAAAVFADLGDDWGRSLALVAGGAAARSAGRPEEALELLGEAVRCAERGRHGVMGALAEVALGYAHLDQGQVDAAGAAAGRAADLVVAVDLEPHARLGAQVLLAQVHRARGEPAAALALLDSALSVVREAALLFPRRQALAHRAGVLLDLGRVDEALIASEQALAAPGEDVRSHVVALRVRAAVLRAVGREDDAREVLAEALRAASATGAVAEVRATQAALAAAGSG